jgi:nitroimidazol reductase NimA-like FMN-containing flavoprotein (pyridoxamine 5'-phosphate oxidase superfamily)
MTFTQTERSTVRRLPARAGYDRATAYAILDEALIAHVGLADGDQPFVIPMMFARSGDAIVLHGSPVSRLLRSMKTGLPVCVTVTHIDGLVLARSAFHHSMNYRSVVVLGVATVVEDLERKAELLDALVEHLVPGRTADARRPSTKELLATIVLTLPIEEASVKVRTGPPLDDEDDLELPVWAGVLPLRLAPGMPVADGDTKGATVPAYLEAAARFRG